MKSQQKKYANGAVDAALESDVKRIVNAMLQAGEVDIELDDTEIRELVKRSSDAAHAVLQRVIADTDAGREGLAQRLDLTDATVKESLNRIAAVKKVVDEGGNVKDAVSLALSKAKGTDEARIRQVADELFQKTYAAEVVKAGKTGDASKVPLPPLLKVDPFYVENEQTATIEFYLDTNRHAIASGPSGSGKTYPFEQVLRKRGLRYIKVSCADGLSQGDFIAKQGVRANKSGTGSETYWLYGFIVVAMLNGLPLILDEIDKVQPELLAVLNAVTETRRFLIAQTGEAIVAKPGFIVFATCNTLRDTTGVYSGFRLDASLPNRFVGVKADYLPAKDEIKILVRVGVAEKDAKNLVGIFNGLREAYNAGKLTQAPSTRIAVRICRMMLGQNDEGNGTFPKVSLTQAFDYAMLNLMPDAEVNEALAVIKQGI